MIELLIALGLTSVVILSVMKLYVVQHENYLVQEDVAEMQQSARVSLTELGRQVRMAGHHVPMGVPAIVASDTDPDTITVVYHGNDCEAYLAADMASEADAIVCDAAVDCFQANQWVYIHDPDSARGEWFRIVAAGGNSIVPDGSLSRIYPEDAIVYALNRYKYYIDQSVPDNPFLMVQNGFGQAEPYSEHLDDLQFDFRLANGAIVSEPVLLEDVREVIITVQTKTGRPGDLGLVEGEGDERESKKRSYSSSVNVRNIGS